MGAITKPACITFISTPLPSSRQHYCNHSGLVESKRRTRWNNTSARKSVTCASSSLQHDDEQSAGKESTSPATATLSAMNAQRQRASQIWNKLNGIYSEHQKALRAIPIAVALCTGSVLLLGAPDAHAYGLENGRLAKCKGDAPCMSTTSVGNPSKFGPPWSYQPQTGDAGEAWASLKVAVATVHGDKEKEKGTIVESVDGPDEYYLRAEFPSTWKGIDDVEFRLIKRDSLVTYRSASRDAIYVYPIQAPINTNKNKNRLEDIRNLLGWEEFAGSELYVSDGTKQILAPED